MRNRVEEVPRAWRLAVKEQVAVQQRANWPDYSARARVARCSSVSESGTRPGPRKNRTRTKLSANGFSWQGTRNCEQQSVRNGKPAARTRLTVRTTGSHAIAGAHRRATPSITIITAMRRRLAPNRHSLRLSIDDSGMSVLRNAMLVMIGARSVIAPIAFATPSMTSWKGTIRPGEARSRSRAGSVENDRDQDEVHAHQSERIEEPSAQPETDAPSQRNRKSAAVSAAMWTVLRADATRARSRPPRRRVTDRCPPSRASSTSVRGAATEFLLGESTDMEIDNFGCNRTSFPIAQPLATGPSPCRAGKKRALGTTFCS